MNDEVGSRSTHKRRANNTGHQDKCAHVSPKAHGFNTCDAVFTMGQIRHRHHNSAQLLEDQHGLTGTTLMNEEKSSERPNNCRNATCQSTKDTSARCRDPTPTQDDARVCARERAREREAGRAPRRPKPHRPAHDLCGAEASGRHGKAPATCGLLRLESKSISDVPGQKHHNELGSAASFENDGQNSFTPRCWKTSAGRTRPNAAESGGSNGTHARAKGNDEFCRDVGEHERWRECGPDRLPLMAAATMAATRSDEPRARTRTDARAEIPKADGRFETALTAAAACHRGCPDGGAAQRQPLPLHVPPSDSTRAAAATTADDTCVVAAASSACGCTACYHWCCHWCCR